jgi:hypothetical protein
MDGLTMLRLATFNVESQLERYEEMGVARDINARTKGRVRASDHHCV